MSLKKGKDFCLELSIKLFYFREDHLKDWLEDFDQINHWDCLYLLLEEKFSLIYDEDTETVQNENFSISKEDWDQFWKSPSRVNLFFRWVSIKKKYLSVRYERGFEHPSLQKRLLFLQNGNKFRGIFKWLLLGQLGLFLVTMIFSLIFFSFY